MEETENSQLQLKKIKHLSCSMMEIISKILPSLAQCVKTGNTFAPLI